MVSPCKQAPITDPCVNDVTDFARLERALTAVGMDDIERHTVFATVAALLHLGNVQFDDAQAGTQGGDTE